MSTDTDTRHIRDWRSIVTLVVFVLTNIVVLFPFHIPFYVPRKLWSAAHHGLISMRFVPPRVDERPTPHDPATARTARNGGESRFIRLAFPMDFVTAPLIADLFLLAILAIGRKEVHDGTVGASNIFPIDIMVFFITLAYIAISIDASGLIRYLAFKVLQKGGKKGRWLFLYLYVFFFALAGFVGNDPVILSGTAFLAYMTRVASNITDPRAWIFTQFAVANIASAILVSSNPTNLVLAGAFQIKFIDYTVNMIVPVVITAIVLFPFLLYLVFRGKDSHGNHLIPTVIDLHELSEEKKRAAPINPNIPYARGSPQNVETENNCDEPGNSLPLEEIMNPFLDRKGATFGALLMAATLITILVLNAVTDTSKERPVFWVTLPAAFVLFCWDLWFGWQNRTTTRGLAREFRRKAEEARVERSGSADQEVTHSGQGTNPCDQEDYPRVSSAKTEVEIAPTSGCFEAESPHDTPSDKIAQSRTIDEKAAIHENQAPETPPRSTLASLLADAQEWSQETFPTVAAVLGHLPWKLIPFALAMFVLVQALVSTGWVAVFAYGWDHWVNKTGTVGAIGGMAFLSVIMCNFAGTNIGTTILLCRVVQAWIDIHKNTGVPITQRTFWATVYSMAIGVNYGAFSAAFSGALAGLLWRDILERKDIRVKGSEFARHNLPIIAVSMAVGCAVLVGEVYITRSSDPYNPVS